MNCIYTIIKKLIDGIKRLFETGALHVVFGTFATKFVAFFGSIVVVRLLSKDDYGLMSYVENKYNYALIFAGLGLSYAVLRYLVMSDSVDDKKRYYDYIIKHSIYRNLIIAAVLILLSIFLKFPDNYARAKTLIPLTALLLPFQDFLNENLYTIRSFFRNKLYAYLAFFSATALILGRIAGAYIGGVSGVLWSRVLINAVFSVLCFIFVKKTFFRIPPVSLLSKDQARKVNTYSLQYMITNGFWAIFMLNDAFMLGQLLNDPLAMADYHVACVLPSNISIFATAIGIYVGPYFTKNENDPVWVKKYYRIVFIVNACIVGAVTLGIIILAKPLILFMYGEKYLNTVRLMRMLLVAAFINSGLRYTSANLLAAMGEVKYNMIVSGIGITLQLILDMILIPKYGTMAVAISNCIIFLFMAITLFFIFLNKHC